VLDNVIDKMRVLCKCMFSEKGTAKAIWKLTYTAVGYISSIFGFSQLLNKLMGLELLENLCKQHWFILIMIGILSSLIHNHEKIHYKWKRNSDGQLIELTVDNLFCVPASSYVIPTNSYFHTKMEGEYISPKSVQGAFQEKYFKTEKKNKELNKMLTGNLKDQKVLSDIYEDSQGNMQKCPIGTVAKIDNNNKHYYFVAINDINEHGTSINQNYSNIDKSLEGLVKAIKGFGHHDDLATPIIGTGKAAISGASTEKVAKDIVDKLLDPKNKISRKLTICISPKDYVDGKVNLKKIAKYIDYKCEFPERS